MDRPHAVLAMRPALRPLLFDADAEERLARLAEADPEAVVTDFADPRAAGALVRAEVLITGWDCPVLDEPALARMPALRAVLHSGGSVKHHMTDAAWARGLLVSSAVADNAVPVAEYTLAMVISAGKRLPEMERAFRAGRDGRDWLHWSEGFVPVGNHRRVIGVVGLSRVGRRVVEMLRVLDATVLVHDPYVPDEVVRGLGAVPTGLDALVAASDVVSLHAPSTAETRHQMDRRRLALMKDGATLINTARGALVDTAALADELRAGRLYAVADVTDPDPLPPDSELFDLPNLTLTPHVAGSIGGELRRLGDFVLAELRRLTAGTELLGRVLPETLPSIA
ncbi:D-isomer specific 2-hydroxyacid dehydrogenase NAD-binding [Catenulispora acidiphila DSM 44928]|uniref:D-isomer specific 2-hydroxyacid dehydrogenase NAD-binding n=1 Tax=Catenulispora acidiphila (strain DSM 44928 / JCM 14897 / NBRC 102108 / NRRL B-24433 / ID139908) TaxID=479433 RepID=C7PZ04_CATAD|nr:hydroxyacid dehydrogenase [Catenulispora acidiphila]ACU69560.1 D-isomer specific 2-hydroxyacid dehydrogenase NAD-binding [Catenulispora acidiphila DSM 44928]